jgi:hypothetical protein
MDDHIIPMGNQLEGMADAVQNKAYETLMARPVGEDYCGDGSDEAEHAFDIGLSFYENISDMYQTTLNLFAAGLFHAVEQQLADLTRDGAIEIAAPDTQLQRVQAWYLRHFELDLERFPSWAAVDELRLVANTTKHAEGPAARQLREIRPRLFQKPILRKVDPDTPIFHMPVNLPLGGDGLYITSDDFRAYHQVALDLFDWLACECENRGDQYFPC